MWKSRARTLSYSMPTDTAPMMSPLASRSGTFPRAERPRVPLSICMISRPASGTLGSVETTLPIWRVSVCDQRTPSMFMITMYSAPLACRMRSATACTGPSTVGSEVFMSAAIWGWAAVVCAIARARCMAWSSSSLLRGARNRPVASTTTPLGDRQLHQEHLREDPAGQTETQASDGGTGSCVRTVRGAGVPVEAPVVRISWLCCAGSFGGAPFSPPRR